MFYIFTPQSLLTLPKKKKKATPLGLQNHYALVPESQKLSELVNFLAAHSSSKIMVFLLTCAHVDYYARLLPKIEVLQGLKIEALHGKMVFVCVCVRESVCVRQRERAYAHEREIERESERERARERERELFVNVLA